MEVSRRGFLGAAIATAVMPFPEFKPSKQVKEVDFDPNGEYGNSCPYTGRLNGGALEFVKKFLYEDMIKVVPLQYRYRVHYRVKMPTDYGRCKGVTWYYKPNSNVVGWSNDNGFGVF